MKKRVMALICVAIFVLTMTCGSKISATDDPKDAYEPGKMYLDGLEFPEGTVLFKEYEGEKYPSYSLKKFFEGIGGRVIFDEETGDAKIYYLNDILCWVNIPTKSGFNEFCIYRGINGASVITGYGHYVHSNCFVLFFGSMTGGTTSAYDVINGEIYFGTALEGIATHLGYKIDIDRDAKIVKMSTQTVNNFLDGSFERVRIDEKKYAVDALADGSWVHFKQRTLEEMQAGKERERLMLIDDKGRIYRKTDYVMPAVNTTIGSRNAKFHDAESKNGEWNEGTAYFYNLKFPKGTVYYDTPKGTMVSLRGFFEGIGSEVIYDEKTKDVKIKHTNQELLWQKEVVPYAFTMRRSVSPSNVKIDSTQGYFKLNEKYDEGRYTRIDGRTYIDLESFKRMASYLGYTVENNEETRELRISPITLINWGTVSDRAQFLNVVNGKRYLLSPLSDGSWIGHRENDEQDVIFVDGAGTIYELTDEITEDYLESIMS